MVNTNSNLKPTAKEHFLELIKTVKLSDLIAIAGLFVIIPGFIIVNIYLANFGIQDISLFKLKYLSAGFLFVGILSTYMFFVWKRIYYAEEDVGNIYLTISPNKKSVFVGLFSMVIVYADNAFGIVFATAFISLILFPSNEINTLFGFFVIFFIIDYPLVKLKRYQKSPKFSLSISCIFHILSVLLFFYFVEAKEPKTLFWTFLGITIAINFILDQRKKMQSGGAYITRLEGFDLIWISLLIIVLSINFGKTLYGKITSGFGGGKPISVNLLIDQKDISFFREISINVNNNASEEVSLLLETNSEIYFKKKNFAKDNNDRVIQMNKHIIKGVIYLK